MAGAQPGFNAALFRSKIQFAFTMAAAPDTDRQLTFYFNDVVAWDADIDGDAVPFDPAAEPTVTTTAPVKVPCGIEVIKAGAESTPFGTVLATKLKITLLDEDYVQVAEADYVVYDGEKYLKEATGAPQGLFEVGIFTMSFVAENDA